MLNQRHTDLADTQLSRQRHRQHQCVELVVFCLHCFSYLWKHNETTVQLETEVVTVCIMMRAVSVSQHTHTFTAWEESQSSCRIPKHTTHTLGSSSFSLKAAAAASSSDGATEPLGSSLALLLGGSSGGSGSAASWDFLFSSVDSLMKALSSFSVFCKKGYTMNDG